MIYCVEDEANIRELILYALKANQHEGKGFDNGEDMMAALEHEIPDLILLDIMLPGEDGMSILKKLRSSEAYGHIPIIMLTAKSSEMDKINGLDQGADDYILKPFSVLELIARINALLRRTQKSSRREDVIEIDGVIISCDQRIVKFSDGEEIPLTYKEFELLLYLFQNKNIVLDREKILQHIWGYDFEGETRTVDVHIASLRNKLKEKAYLIETIRNVGYKVSTRS